MTDEETRSGRGTAHVPGRHWVSELNFRPEITAGFAFPDPFALIDSTIRKAVYTAGVHPSTADVLRIGEVLEDLGVRDESLNVWWWDEAEPNGIEFAVMRAVAGAGFAFRVNVFTDTLVGDGRRAPPLMEKTVGLLAEAGVSSLAAGLLQPPDRDAEARQEEHVAALAARARDAGLPWTLTVAHCGRRDFTAMMRGVNVAIAHGMQRLDLMDSTSALSPEAMKLFLHMVRDGLAHPVPITMHTHDDFGMATAATVAAVTAGASPDVALNGVSYRSGFAALEEVVLALDVLYGIDTGIRLDRLQWASERLARIMGFAVHPLKPVVGAHQFLRESPGDILHLLNAGPDSFPQPGQSAAAALTGGAMAWVWGKQSSAAVVHAVAGRLGLELSDTRARAVQAELDARLLAKDSYPKWLAPAEVEACVRSASAGSPPPEG